MMFLDVFVKNGGKDIGIKFDIKILQRLSVVYIALWKYIYPQLTKWRDPDTGEGKDTFQVQIDFYRERYEEEFQAILRDGVEYDEDGGGTVSDSEKEPIHFLRLVR